MVERTSIYNEERRMKTMVLTGYKKRRKQGLTYINLCYKHKKVYEGG